MVPPIPARAVSDLLVSRGIDMGNGSVHSVFATSFNLELDGRLVHVGSDASPLSCYGVNVGEREMAGLAEGLAAGDEARLRGGRLRIYRRSGVAELDLAAGAVRPMGVPAGSGLPVGADEALFGAVERVGLLDRIGLPWPDRSRAAVSDLARFSIACLRLSRGEAGERVLTAGGVAGPSARERYDASRRAMRGAVDYLLGRGLGLTPSGDDVLCGFGCALRLLFGATGLADPFYRAVSELMPGRTTAVSEAYLAAMVAGYANEDCLDLAGAIAQGAWERLAACLDRVLTVGHTSGADGLLGFSAAFGCLL